MIRIAICDDDIDKGKWIYSKVWNLMNSYFCNCEIQIFSSSKTLLHEIGDGMCFELLLLDIEMPELDGMKLTEIIKTYLSDVLIIFITSHEKYVYESFKVQPFRFIPKIYIEKMLPLAMKDAMEYIKKSEGKFLCIENNNGLEKIPTRIITYIWHREKYAYIEKTNGEHAKVRKTLKRVYDELPQEDFVWLDRGCICNLIHIGRISRGDVVLIDGTRLQVSKDRLTEVKDTIRKYWIGKEKNE
ncbi:MAG: LytR/AlgR family response regulator transcription factor [Lachnospiraceae bacterium]